MTDRDMPHGSNGSTLFLSQYFRLLGLERELNADLTTLRDLHRSHFYTVPFENYSMHARRAQNTDTSSLLESMLTAGRGGLCFETGRLMQLAFTALGYSYRRILAGLISSGRGPATHQVFVIECDGQDWVFDIGYGAQGPRGLLPLVHGAIHSDPILSSRISLDCEDGTTRWVVSVQEHVIGERNWRPIYTFTTAPVNDAEIEMAHHYTATSPTSLLNIHKVISIPTRDGRVSLRDGFFTELHKRGKSSRQLSSRQELQLILKHRFSAEVDPAELPILNTEDDR